MKNRAVHILKTKLNSETLTVNARDKYAYDKAPKNHSDAFIERINIKGKRRISDIRKLHQILGGLYIAVTIEYRLNTIKFKRKSNR